MTVLALAATAAQAEALSASPGLPIVLAPETAPAVLFAIVLGLGVVLQVAGRVYVSRSAVLIGAGLVLGAALFDRDPVLVVGQLVLVAALWPKARKKARMAGGRSSRNTVREAAGSTARDAG